VLPARFDEYEREPNPYRYGLAAPASSRTRLSSQLVRPRDFGQMGDSWRNILLDQFRRRGANFFGL
jgi:hypothetical protein